MQENQELPDDIKKIIASTHERIKRFVGDEPSFTCGIAISTMAIFDNILAVMHEKFQEIPDDLIEGAELLRLQLITLEEVTAALKRSYSGLMPVTENETIH